MRELNLDSGQPLALSVDNTGARNLAYNPEHHQRTKHIDRRHFFIREMVEEGRIVVPFVKSADNLADFFTKPLAASVFFPMRDKIMGVDGPLSGDGAVKTARRVCFDRSCAGPARVTRPRSKPQRRPRLRLGLDEYPRLVRLGITSLGRQLRPVSAVELEACIVGIQNGSPLDDFEVPLSHVMSRGLANDVNVELFSRLCDLRLGSCRTH